MEFSFEVDPENDIAVGTEMSFEETTFEEYEEGEDSFDISGYDPLTSTEAKPGSEDKVKMLAARYAAGVPLWHTSDCYDHGPGGGLVLGADDGEGFVGDLDEDEAG